MYLPSDPNMLLSMINMKLRDLDVTLADFCADEDIDQDDLEARLSAAGFHYDAEHNRFL